jgi:hypothetical protein
LLCEIRICLPESSVQKLCAVQNQGWNVTRVGSSSGARAGNVARVEGGTGNPIRNFVSPAIISTAPQP